MNLELGRSVGSTEVSPFIGSREQVDETKSACPSSFNLTLGGLAKRGPLTLSFSPSRVVFTIRLMNSATEVLLAVAKCQEIRSLAQLIEVAGSFRLRS